MTLKELFEKVENYNDIAELMHTQKASIRLDERSFQGDRFLRFENFCRCIRHEYVKEVADKILKYDNWEIGKEISIEWTHGIGIFVVELIEA